MKYDIQKGWHKIEIRFRPEDFEQLRKFAFDDRVSLNEVVRRSLAVYITGRDQQQGAYQARVTV